MTIYADVKGTFDTITHELHKKGYTLSYEHSLRLNDYNWRLLISARLDNEEAHRFSEYVDSDEDLPDLLHKGLEFARNVPEATLHRKAKFREKLVALSEEAEALEIGLEYVELLKATAKKLASNALSGPKWRVWDYNDAPPPISESCVVRVRLSDGREVVGKVSDFDWSLDPYPRTPIIEWRLASREEAEGYLG